MVTGKNVRDKYSDITLYRNIYLYRYTGIIRLVRYLSGDSWKMIFYLVFWSVVFSDGGVS